MAKLTKEQAKKHAAACELLKKDRLTLEDKYFVLDHWREDAHHINSVNGAFFTPTGLARDLAIEIVGPRVIDLCAGIGSLAFAVWSRFDCDRSSLQNITCVELNPDYVAVGRKILPEAVWIQADVFALPGTIGHFDCAISNPPFGPAKASGKAPRFTGNVFEYRVIDIASDIADYGVFLVPQASAPFEYSGTSVHRSDWSSAPPAIEIVTADFQRARQARSAATNGSLAQYLSGTPTETEQLSKLPADQLDLF